MRPLRVKRIYVCEGGASSPVSPRAFSRASFQSFPRPHRVHISRYEIHPSRAARALASPERVGLRIVIIESSLSRTATLFSTRNAARTPFVFFSTAYRIARARTPRQSSPLTSTKRNHRRPLARRRQAGIHPSSFPLPSRLPLRRARANERVRSIFPRSIEPILAPRPTRARRSRTRESSCTTRS